MTDTIEKRYYTLKEAGEKIGISRQAVKERMRVRGILANSMKFPQVITKEDLESLRK